MNKHRYALEDNGVFFDSYRSNGKRFLKGNYLWEQKSIQQLFHKDKEVDQKNNKPWCPMASKNNEIPKHELQALARAFADDIIAFFETEEGQKEYEEWLQQKKNTEKVA